MRALALAEAATTAMKSDRALADEKAREAISAAEASLVAALDGEALRGLPDLGDRVFGYRVGVDVSRSARLAPGRPGLVLEKKGRLVLATLFASGAAFVQAPPKSMLVASILDPYVAALEAALSVHARDAEKRGAQFGRIEVLAGRLCAALM